LAKSSFVHSELSSSEREARLAVVFFAIEPYLFSACPAEADNPEILAARRHDRCMKTPTQTRNHAQARLPVVAAGIFDNQRRVPGRT
jgi:hypothetical protein